MKLNKVIWVAKGYAPWSPMGYRICFEWPDNMTPKQAKAISLYEDLDSRTFHSYRLAQDIVNMARQKMKEKLQCITSQ